MAKILVVDDDQGMREFLEIMMTREGYRVVTAGDAGKALARCRKETFDLIITDLKMPIWSASMSSSWTNMRAVDS